MKSLLPCCHPRYVTPSPAFELRLASISYKIFFPARDVGRRGESRKSVLRIKIWIGKNVKRSPGGPGSRGAKQND